MDLVTLYDECCYFPGIELVPTALYLTKTGVDEGDGLTCVGVIHGCMYECDVLAWAGVYMRGLHGSEDVFI